MSEMSFASAVKFAESVLNAEKIVFVLLAILSKFKFIYSLFF
jgi:hypothetical protein